MRNQEVNSFWEWLKEEKYSVSVTLFAAIIPSIVTFLGKNLKIGNNGLLLPFIDNLSFAESFNYIQFSFILVTLFVLVYYQSRTRKDLVQCKAYIIKYIKKNTNRKLKTSSDAESAYSLVKTSVIQFYWFWIVVWLLWLGYYFGGVIFPLTDEMQYAWSIYGKVFDFLNSTAMLLIYIVLVSITVRSEIRRNEDNSITWYGILIWFVIFTLFLILLICEANHKSNEYSHYGGLLVSSFAAMVFVMVLGKLNSHYLQVPRIFMMVMYFHAIIQMYNPIVKMIGMVEKQEQKHVRNKEQKQMQVQMQKQVKVQVKMQVQKREQKKEQNKMQEQKYETDLLESVCFLQYVVPVVTLTGKVCLMLTLCWIVDKKRLIFFIIHRSAAIEITQNLLSELEQEPIDF